MGVEGGDWKGSNEPSLWEVQMGSVKLWPRLEGQKRDQRRSRINQGGEAGRRTSPSGKQEQKPGGETVSWGGGLTKMKVGLERLAGPRVTS